MTRKEILEKTIDFDDAIHRIVRLEQENAKLKCECRRCVHTDCPCILSDYGKDRNGICDHFKDIFDENAELKEELVGFRLKVEALEGKTPWKDIKDKSEVIGKLTKAKEIIKELLDSCFGYNSKTVNYVVKAKAGQFLKGDGCSDCFCEDCTKEDCGIKKLGLVEVEK